MKRFILSLLILAVLPLSGAAQPREPLQSRISRDSILIGDQIEWTLDFSIAPGEAARVSKPGPAPVPGVEALGEMARDTLSSEKGTQHLRGHITLTSWNMPVPRWPSTPSLSIPPRSNFTTSRGRSVIRSLSRR